MTVQAVFLTLQRSSDTALRWLIPLFLLIDCINGALLQLNGSSLALSALYKSLILLLMALSLLRGQAKVVLCFAAALLLLLAGPAIHWPALASRWVMADMQLALKLISPLLAFCYLRALFQRDAARAMQLCRLTLAVSAAVLLLNTAVGLAGFGFSAYQPLDGVAQSFLGIKGYFYSTNELSSVLLVLSCALLTLSFRAHKVLYALISGCALLMALLLLTKTGLFGVLLLVLLIPLLMQNSAFWYQQRFWVAGALLLMLLVLAVVVVNAELLLRQLGIYDKLQFVYQQRGITGILLSSRDFYAGQIWQVITQHYSDWQQLLGVGQGSVALHLKKYFAELDWFDLLVLHGVAGLAVLLLTFAVFLRYSWQQCASGYGRSLLLLNTLLLVVSSVAGHILTSGMLWLPWALCNVYLLHLATMRSTEPERT